MSFTESKRWRHFVLIQYITGLFTEKIFNYSDILITRNLFKFLFYNKITFQYHSTHKKNII